MIAEGRFIARRRGLAGIADAAGARIVMCPLTEGYLGDGTSAGLPVVSAINALLTSGARGHPLDVYVGGVRRLRGGSCVGRGLAHGLPHILERLVGE